MTYSLPLPDWLPSWVHLAALLALLFVALLFVMMPFSVFGTKSRLERIEARLDEIQGEIRSLALRLPETDEPELEQDDRPRSRVGLRPPIPPAPSHSHRSEPGRSARTEPRLY